ncbi:MAG: SH3 domain-containing protein [Clostridiales bacterium]|nr:SH3 domain-containing protein [Clostridiales bacterium]
MSTRIKLSNGRITPFLLAFLMVISVFAAVSLIKTDIVYADGETGKVATDVLNVRSGAGTNYSRIGTITQGKTFTVTGTAKDSYGVTWYKFTFNSRNGYVSSQYVNITQPSVTPVSDLQGTVKSAEGLNVRSGPGTNYGRLGLLSNGKTFTITGKSQASNGVWWYRLSYNGSTGFVTSQYVTTKSTAAAVTTVENTTGTVNDKDGLNVRSGPGTSYSKLGYYANGKTFAVTGKAQASDGVWWYQLTYGDKTGYVSSAYVKTTTTTPTEPSAPEGTTDPAETEKRVGTVNASDGLFVRSGPGTNYGKIGAFDNKKTFDITGEEKSTAGVIWYKLTYGGKTGYVCGTYVTVTTGENAAEETTKPEPVTFQMGTVNTSDGLNVRTGPGTGYSILTVLNDKTSVVIIGSEKASNGKTWYKYQYSSSRVGYVCSDYMTVKTVTSDSDFEAYMDAQGFPESYKPGLRVMHAAHPQWVFKASKVGYSWSDVIAKESVVGKNLVSSSSPVSYRSTDPKSYNSSTGVWAKFDGSWYAANSTVVAYYMDPRNFMSESGIYQFMTHRHDGASQNATTVNAVISGSFMQSRNPGGGYSSYGALISAAGSASGVNPNVLAAMIIQEQGWDGSALVSGTYSGYAGYYNFFNIGAYTADGMNAIQRGLWYASNSGSYSRPWNTPYKSVLGGAQFYAEEYVNDNQDAYYYKKFNVKNGLGNVATHQYMTNVAGASSEGSIVKRAYNSNSNYPVIFDIPVYNNMPAAACPLP